MRDFAAKEGLDEQAALQKGMEVKSVEFVKQGRRFITKREPAPPLSVGVI